MACVRCRRDRAARGNPLLLPAQIMNPIIVPYDCGMNRLDAPDLLMFSPSPSTVLAGPPASPRAPAACLSSSMSRSNLSTTKGEVALKWLRMTEEGSSHMMTVEESVGVTLLRPLGPAPLDLITIFGQARKGKSFLLNKLASQTNLFPVQASNLPCTIGVDISPTFLNLEKFCPSQNEELLQSPLFEKTRVGFLDAEGQGDQGIEYDVHLVAPLLLVSKVLIYNWSGRPARDDILQKLSCLAEAARRVDVEQSEKPEEKVFGHLHLVLRDNPDADGVQDHVFSLEPEKRNSVDALLQRNRIRRILSESFESISVWGFPSPVDDATVLNRGEFSADDATAPFDDMVAGLRQAIRAQARECKSFNGKPLTGPLIASLMPEIARALNEGVDLLPKSLYEQSEQRTASLAKQACVDAFDDFVQQLRREMPVPQDDLSARLAAEQKRAMAELKRETAEISTKIKDRAEEELAAYVGKESAVCCSENEKRILTKVRRVSEMAVSRFRETFEAPQRSADEPVDRQQLIAEYNFRAQRVLDLFDGEMEGFLDVTAVVRERHDVERAMENIRDSVGSLNEAKIERDRAESERRRADEERRRREEAERRMGEAEGRLRELEDSLKQVQAREFEALARAEAAERMANMAQELVEEEKARADEVERRAAQERAQAHAEHERELRKAAVLAQREMIKPCCPVA